MRRLRENIGMFVVVLVLSFVGSALGQAGFPSPQFNGIGIGTPPTVGNSVTVLNTQNGENRLTYTNASTGSNAQTCQTFFNALSGGGICEYGTGYISPVGNTGNELAVPDQTEYFGTGAGGVSLASINTGPIIFSLNGHNFDGVMICKTTPACTRSQDIFAWGFNSDQIPASIYQWQLNGNFWFNGHIAAGAGDCCAIGDTLEITPDTVQGAYLLGNGSKCDATVANNVAAAGLCVIHNTQSVALGLGQVANNATAGFPYLSSTTSGVPTGTPGAVTGFVPCVIDNTDSKLECYFGGSWNHLTFTGGS